MLVARIRQVETRTVDVRGESLDEIHDQLAAQRPDGFELVLAPVSMAKASTEITAKGTYARRDAIQDVSGATMDEIRAQIPDGWQLLYVLED